ncbi:MAG: MFS transporter, partial [Candidatus Binataceae bacterium]
MPTGDGLTTRGAIAIYATGFFSLAFLVIMGLAVPLWTVVLHVSPAVTGLLLGAPALLPLIFSIHVGTLMDRTDTRIVMLALSIFGTILPLLYPVFPWIPALFALQCLAGFIYQLSWVGAQTLMGRAFPGDHRRYGRFSSAASIGMFIGPLLDGFAWSAFGPWGAFGLASLWGLGFTISVVALPRLDRGSAVKLDWRAGLIPDFHSYVAALRLLRIPAIVLVVLATSLRISASAIRGSFYSVYLNHDAHMSGSQIGILL